MVAIATKRVHKRRKRLWTEKRSSYTWDSRVNDFLNKNRERLQYNRGKAIKEKS
jgi:hypothetical protein